MTYSELAVAVKDAARNELRTMKVLALQSDIFEVEKQLQDLGDRKDILTKSLAVSAYKLSKLDPEDPRYEDQVKSNEENSKETSSALEQVEKVIETTQKDISAIQEQVAKVEAGEVKVCYDELLNRAEALIRAHTLAQVQSLG
jgi:predicted  nucleic acid-binding Zn-ribbon protein